MAPIKADFCDVEKRYWFDRSLLMDIGVTLDVALEVPMRTNSSTGTINPSAFRCYLCYNSIKKEKMRHHVSWHILSHVALREEGHL